MPPKKKETKYELEEYQLRETTKKLEALLRGLKKSGLEDFMTYMSSPWKIMIVNLWAGIFRGLGFLLGATVVMAALAWIVSLFVDFPLVGQYFSDLQEALETIANVIHR